MKTILIVGSIIVTLALIFYLTGIITEQRKRLITKTVLIFISLGLLFDISSTICMITGSTNSPFTFHGFIGYTGLLAMIIETLLVYRFYFKNGSNVSVPKGLNLYSRFALILWVAVYITGALLVAFR